MKVTSCQQVTQKPVEMEGASGCHVRWLIGKEDRAPNFAMREFVVEPGGHTPRHHHPYEHEIYVVAGQGTVSCRMASSCFSDVGLPVPRLNVSEASNRSQEMDINRQTSSMYR